MRVISSPESESDILKWADATDECLLLLKLREKRRKAPFEWAETANDFFENCDQL